MVRLTRLEGALALVVAFRIGRGVVCVDVDAIFISINQLILMKVYYEFVAKRTMVITETSDVR